MESGHRELRRDELNAHLDLCAHCGGSILRGAMRCVSCGKILKTPEEQSAAFRDLETNQRGSTVKKLMKIAVVFTASMAVYYLYSDHIHSFALRLLGR